MQTTTEQNKAIVIRFNRECIEQGSPDSFKQLLAADAVNHTVPFGMPNGPESFTYFLNNVLRIGFPDLKVEILDQVAEGDKVVTRKIIHGTHTGEFMGVRATNKTVEINVIDIIRLRDGKYLEHWALSNITDIVRELSSCYTKLF